MHWLKEYYGPILAVAVILSVLWQIQITTENRIMRRIERVERRLDIIASDIAWIKGHFEIEPRIITKRK